jgi:hypothetical protein
MLNKDLIFSLMSIMGDEMLFPDWANAQEIRLRSDGWVDDTYTVTQDSFLIGLYSESSEISPAGVSINGKRLFNDNSGAGSHNYCPCFYCTKGTVLKNNSKTNFAYFNIIPLVKSGGGLKYPVVFFRSYQLNNMVCINRIKFKKRA